MRTPHISRLAIALVSGVQLSSVFVLTPIFADTPNSEKPKSIAELQWPGVPPEWMPSIKEHLERLKAQWQARLVDDVDYVKAATDFDEALVPQFTLAAEQLLAEAINTRAASIEALLRQQLATNPNLSSQAFLQSLSNISTGSGQSGQAPVNTEPHEDPRWSKLLEAQLNPEQLERLQRKNTQVQEALNRYLATIETQLRPFIVNAANHIVADLDRDLNLSDERFKLLEEAFSKAVDSSVESCVTLARREMLSLPRAKREVKIKTTPGIKLPTKEQAPDNQPIWLESLATILTPEERQRLTADDRTFLQRRTLVRTELLLSIMSERVAPSSAQREQLAVVIEKLIREQASAPDSNPFVVDGEIDLKRFLAFSARADKNELQRILSPVQYEQWLRAGAVRPRPSRTAAKPAKIEAVPADKDTAPVTESEDPESIISDFLFKKAEAYRREKKEFMLLQVEDAARAAQLSADVTMRLKTAALGAVEAAIIPWKIATEQNTRQNALQTSLGELRQRLAGIGENVFFRTDTPVERQRVWLNALQNELTETELKQWQSLKDERRLKQSGAIARLLLLNIDRTVGLRNDQHELLHSALTRSIWEFGPDIADMFSGNDDAPWYFRGFTMYLPFQGIPEGKMKEILNSRQWARWIASQIPEINRSNWESVQQRHNIRVNQSSK